MRRSGRAPDGRQGGAIADNLAFRDERALALFDGRDVAGLQLGIKAGHAFADQGQRFTYGKEAVNVHLHSLRCTTMRAALGNK